MSIRVVETGGVSIKSAIINQDLTGCFFDADTCMPCRDGMSTASHTRRNVLYKGTCLICKAMGIKTEYWGESGSSARHRFSEHEDDILNLRTKNAFAKHLDICHKDRVGDTSAFEFQSIKTYKKPLERQVSEAVKILHCSENKIKLMNGKSEWHKPALTRHQPTREIGN